MLRSLPISLLLVLAAGTCMWAQEEGISIGASLGYEYGVPLAIERDSGIVNRWPGSSGFGTSYNHTFLFGLKLVDPSLLAPGIGFAGRLSLALSRGGFTSDTFPGALSNGSTTIPIDRYFTITSTLIGVQVDALSTWRPAGEFELAGGVWAGYRLITNIVEYDHRSVVGNAASLEHPDSLVAAGEELASHPLRAGLVVGASLPIRLQRNLALRPGVVTRLDAGAIISDLGFIKSLSVGVDLSLSFDLSTPLADPLDPPPPPAPPRLSATVDVYGGADGEHRSSEAVVSVRSTHHQQMVPLVPAIEFDHGTSTISSTQLRSTRAEAESFGMRALARLDAAGVARRTLDVIGMRLRDNPSARIALKGHVVDGERSELARLRAERVREHLRDVWGIAEDRISIDRTSGTSCGAPMVTIASSSESILSPVATQWIIKSLEAPAIGVEPTFDAEAGVKRWEMIVSHGDRVVARYSSAAPNEEGIDLRFIADRSSELPPLVATMTVEDSAGSTFVARDTLKLTRSNDDRQATKHDEEVSTFVLADGDGCNEAAPRSPSLRSIVERLRAGSRVTVLLSGGDSAYTRAEQLTHELLQAMRRISGTADLHLKVERGEAPANQLSISTIEVRIVTE